jgi:hypothetical protein
LKNNLLTGLIGALAAILALTLAGGDSQAAEVDLKGSFEPEYRWFLEEPGDPRQNDGGLSIALEASLEIDWDGGDHNIVFTPFGRIDAHDKSREHFDIRKARYEGVFDHFEIRVGLDKVYWGVTEFAHIVDVINQTDLVESIDGEEKLGQPMINLSVPTKLGTFEAFVLPFFRERTFPGAAGRPRIDLPIRTGQALYEHKDGDEHVDYAARWSHYFGPIDIGLAHFEGTGRDPLFILPATFAPSNPVLVPLYVQTRQSSIDVQATLDAWLLKFEGLTRKAAGDTYTLAAGGFEYSFFGVRGSAADLGVVAEYLYDDRGQASPQPFNNDLFLGLRLGLNDEHSTALLAGLGRDLDTDALSLRIEAERRLGSDFFLTAELQILSNIPRSSPLASFADDNFLQIRLTHYF